MRSGSTLLEASRNRRHRVAILLLHAGSPADLAFISVWRFLWLQFSNPRVIDISPRWLWLPILFSLIVPFRMRRMRRALKSSWMRTTSSFSATNTADGMMMMRVNGSGFNPADACANNNNSSSSTALMERSTLGSSSTAIHTSLLARRVEEMFRDRLNNGGDDIISVQVECAFLYAGGDGVGRALERLHFLGNYAGVRDGQGEDAQVMEEHLIVLPLYPQYSSTTSAVALDAVMRSAYFSRHRTVPHLHYLRSFCEDTNYIKSSVSHIRAHFQLHGVPDWLHLIFHGTPERFITSGDCYQVECQRTFLALKHYLTRPVHGRGTTNNNSSGNNSRAASETCSESSYSVASPRGLYLNAFPEHRITISFLALGSAEVCVAPRTEEVIHRAPHHSIARSMNEGNPTCHIFCPGMIVEDVAMMRAIQERVVARARHDGWRKMVVIPPLNSSDAMANVVVGLASNFLPQSV